MSSKQFDPLKYGGLQTTMNIVEAMGIKVGSVFMYQDYLDAAGNPDGKWAGFQTINRGVKLVVMAITKTYHGHPDEHFAEIEYKKAEENRCQNRSS